jgi:protein ImuA
MRPENMRPGNMRQGDASSPLPVLAHAGLHELYAAHEVDGPAALGFALALHAMGKREKPVLLITHEMMALEWGAPYGAGLAELGLAPERAIHLMLREPLDGLQAALEGARCKALSGVVFAFRGAARAYDLTASRRLSLAARASGARIILLRAGAPPMPSAAESRFLVRAAASVPLFDHAPGQPAFDLTLLRHRNGSEGGRFILEWNRDVRRLEIRTRSGLAAESATEPGIRSASPDEGALSGALVSFPRHRPHLPDAPGEPFHKAG